MIALDRNALLCDLAETYRIYDFKALPVSVLAVLSVGLRDNSRIKMKMNGVKLTKTEMFLASVIDRLSVLIWQNTENGRNGVNFPASILKKLTADDLDDGAVEVYDSADDFEQAWKTLTGVKHG